MQPMHRLIYFISFYDQTENQSFQLFNEWFENNFNLQCHTMHDVCVRQRPTACSDYNIDSIRYDAVWREWLWHFWRLRRA